MSSNFSSFECRRDIFGSNHLTPKRARKFRCRSKRILCLAQPKHFTPKYDSSCEEIHKIRKVEIIRPNSDPLPTRIKFLALPKVRKLMATRDEYRDYNIERKRIEKIENLAKYSMLTLYSRLANVQPVVARERTRKWTARDWKRHCEWLKKRACPKYRRTPPPSPREKVPLKELRARIENLAQHRYFTPKYVAPCGYESPVKFSAKIHQPSKRIKDLAMPKRNPSGDDDESDEFKFSPFDVHPTALSYKPTQRIIDLAAPKSTPTKVEEEIEVTPAGVVKRALKAAITQRTLELSKPKPQTGGDDDEEEKPNVSKKALKAKATPRILELAKPRGGYTK